MLKSIERHTMWSKLIHHFWNESQKQVQTGNTQMEISSRGMQCPSFVKWCKNVSNHVLQQNMIYLKTINILFCSNIPHLLANGLKMTHTLRVMHYVLWLTFVQGNQRNPWTRAGTMTGELVHFRRGFWCNFPDSFLYEWHWLH